jgi:hypothetical protein
MWGEKMNDDEIGKKEKRKMRRGGQYKTSCDQKTTWLTR